MTSKSDRQKRNDATDTACAWGLIGGIGLMFTPAAPFGIALVGQSVATMITRVGVDAAETMHERKYAE